MVSIGLIVLTWSLAFIVLLEPEKLGTWGRVTMGLVIAVGAILVEEGIRRIVRDGGKSHA